jgi:hypothetical protein
MADGMANGLGQKKKRGQGFLGYKLVENWRVVVKAANLAIDAHWTSKEVSTICEEPAEAKVREQLNAS